MATLTITNLSAAVVNLGDFYIELAVGASVDITRSAGEISSLQALVASLSAGDVSLSVVYSAEEIASGLQAPSKAIEAQDMAPGPVGGDGAHGAIVMSYDVPVGGGGAEELILIAANAFPFPVRVLDAWAKISTGAVGSWVLGDEAAGAGNDIATMDSTTNGARIPTTAPLTGIDIQPGALIGLFLARSDSAAIGEVYMLVKRIDAV